MSKKVFGKELDNETTNNTVLSETNDGVKVTETDKSKEKTDDGAFDKIKKPISPKRAKLKKVSIYAALTVGILAVASVGYAAIKLISEENAIEDRIALAEKEEEEAVSIPDEYKEAAKNIVDKGNTTDAVNILFYIDAKSNAEVNQAFEDNFSTGSVYYIGNNDNYDYAIGKNKSYILTEFEVTSKLLDWSDMPQVYLADGSFTTFDYKYKLTNSGDDEWLDTLANTEIHVGDAIQVLAYTDKIDGGYTVIWQTPDGDSSGYINVDGGYSETDTESTSEESEDTTEADNSVDKTDTTTEAE
jgi:hypothetical protein